MQEYPQIVSLLCFVKNSPTEKSEPPVELPNSSIMDINEIRAFLAQGRAAYEPEPMDTTPAEATPKKKEVKTNQFVPSQKMLEQYANSLNELETLGVKYYPLNYERDGGIIHPPTFATGGENVIVNDSVPFSFRQCREGEAGAPSQFKPRPQVDCFMITLGMLNQVKYPEVQQDRGEIPYHHLELDALCAGISKALLAPTREERESEDAFEARRQQWACETWIKLGGQSFKSFDDFYKGFVKPKVGEPGEGSCVPTALPDKYLHTTITGIKAVIGKELGETSGKRHLQIALYLEYQSYGKNIIPNHKEVYEEGGKKYTRDVSGFVKFAQEAWAKEIRHRMEIFPESSFPDPDTPPRLSLYVDSATRDIATDFFDYVQQHPEEKGKMKKLGLLQPKKKNASPAATSAGTAAKRPRTGGEGTEEPAAKVQATGEGQ